MNACDIIYNNYLTHFGVLGMKWGIRRYQNKDGSLTEAGKKRYGAISSKYEQANPQYKANVKAAGDRARAIGDELHQKIIEAPDIETSERNYLSYTKALDNAIETLNKYDPKNTIGKNAQQVLTDQGDLNKDARTLWADSKNDKQKRKLWYDVHQFMKDEMAYSMEQAVSKLPKQATEAGQLWIAYALDYIDFSD